VRQPLGPLPPMGSGVHLCDDEWQYWTSYFAKLFPTADEAWINKMVVRVIKTLDFSGHTTQMSPEDYFSRTRALQCAIRDLPPDIHNVLMGDR